MPTKVPSKKSKSVVVVFFGSEDNFDMPSEIDYKAMQVRLSEIKVPEDIKALPSIIAGNKLVKLDAQTVTIIDGDKWGFKPTRSTRARKDIDQDPLVARAATQLNLLLTTGSPRFVLVPYYARLEKKA
jgi:hypothetical protein